MDELEGGFLASSLKIEYTGIKTLRSLTAKQIDLIPVDESSSILLCDRMEVTSVQVCGFATNIKKINAGYVFELVDTTGKLDCVFWINGTFDELMVHQLTENNLILISGSLKTFANKKTLNASHFRGISQNELIYHLSSCVYQHLYFIGKIKEEEKKTNVSLSKVQADILDVYRNNQDDDGLDIEIAVAMLKDKYPENNIRSNIDNLINNYHLYSVEGTSYKTTI